MWFLMLGFHLGLPPAAALLVVVATNLVMILPSSPSGIGVFEAAALVALDAYGIGSSAALSYALVGHTLQFLPFVIVGLLLVRGMGRFGRRPRGHQLLTAGSIGRRSG